MKQLLTVVTIILFTICCHSQSLVVDKPSANAFSLTGVVICVDPGDFELVQQAAMLLQKDIEMVTGVKPVLSNSIPGGTCIVIGSAERSSLIKSLEKKGNLNNSAVKNKWEGYHIQSFSNSLVISGSDRRGTAYGVFELSKQLGVSPWYWWADVPVKKTTNLYLKKNISISDVPKVKYRGIFINDEAPALSSWSKEKFGGFNHQFYEKVFELILRLKGNYLWPAMWGNAFYDDDSLNIKMADRYGKGVGN